MIGDGMGITQITSGLYSNGNYLNLERFNDIGLHKNYSSDALITDSAAGATAFACGKKTYNGAIGVDPDTIAIETILEEAEMKNLKTGLVATSTIIHATPASFIAHNRARGNYEEIALDYLKTDTEIFIGGGQKSFERREMDARNLSEELRTKGYTVISFVDKEIDEIDMTNVEKLMYYTADGSPLPVSQGRDYLESASNLSINHLNKNNDDGFFLMIEGSQIDWGGHANDANYIITEMLEFDKSIGAVLDFAERDGNTLVIVTADHETGGFAIQKESKMDSLVTAFTSDYHTGDLIPVFAYGPGSDQFRGIYENTAIYHKMRKAFGWKKKDND
jgi:alkaline phosphatase